MRKPKQLRSLITVALFSALMCVSALIYIPLAVPITLQTLVLFLSFFTLGGRGSVLSVALYIAIGALGLPVFSGFSGGIARLLDATGGYIFGMLLGAFVYAIFDTGRPKSPKARLLAAILALIVIYTSGTLWYALAYIGSESIWAILITCVAPFVIPDLIKLVLAYNISKRIPRQ